MKALSIMQPWASLIAFGQKRIETRSWSTNYRGIIAIHSSSAFPNEYRDLCWMSPLHEIFQSNGINATDDIPRGAIIAIAELIDCVSTDEIFLRYPAVQFPDYEKCFGDFSSGRFGWVLSEVKQIKPIFCKGALGLWTVDSNISACLER